jgi:hypothetical protein
MKNKEQPKIIKVIRVLEYTGTVEWIDKTLNAGAIPKNGAMVINHPDGYQQKISSATIGTFDSVFMVDFDKLLDKS